MRVAIDKLSDVLHSSPHFRCLLDLCTNKDAYLVGGAIRDALIGRPLTDLDLIMPEDPTALARDFARHIGGHWFWLDQERRQSRVVVNRGGGPDYDFALFRAPDLQGDLFDRDFTINALALPLTKDLSGSTLVDPCHGVEHLQQDSLCTVNEASLRNDPLRIIKGVRHATVLGLEIDCGTLSAMQAESSGLGRIAPERIRQEVWKILIDTHAARGLQLLDKSGAGESLFGQGFTKAIPELTVRVQSCRNDWQRLAESDPVVSDWLAEEIEQGLNKETLLLYSLLLASIEPELPATLAEKWLLSRKARAMIAAISALDNDAQNDFASIARNERAYTWWAARRHIEPKLLLLALAVVGSFECRPSAAELRAWVPLVADLDDRRPNDLVDGHWLRNRLHLKGGPEMTKALELLRTAEITGQVSNDKEARQFLARHYQNKH